jgi:DNA-binding NarL/FixJ family response regulator
VAGADVVKRKIILADDHPLLRESVAAYIDDRVPDRLDVVAQVGDGAALVESVKKFDPDVVLVDIGMPRLDGISAVRQLKSIKPGLIALVFSMFEDQAHVVEAIRAGADDYLFKKEATVEAVVGAILRAVGDRPPPRDLLRDRLLQAVRRADQDKLDMGLTRLTGMELEVLKQVAHRGRSMKEIAEVLSGEGSSLSEHTVRKHLEHVYEKLGAQGQAHAVCLAVKYGFISPDEAEPNTSSLG